MSIILIDNLFSILVKKMLNVVRFKPIKIFEFPRKTQITFFILLEGA